MTQNSKDHYPKSGADSNQRPYLKCKRCGQNRRTQPSKGYYYLHTIGWVCRRAASRRETDDFKE